MNELQVGSHVTTRQDLHGIVSAIAAATPGMFLIAAGMPPVGRNITVIFASHMAETPEDLLIVMGEVPIASADEIQQAMTDMNTRREEHLQAGKVERDERQARADKFSVEFNKRRPSWAKAVIVAELMHDDCDSMTDYFQSHSTRTVIIGWSKHTRDLFSEMRKAAATFPETAHMGPGCGHFTVRAVFSNQIAGNGTYYHEGSYSHWHQDIETDQVFKSRTEALAWVDSVEPPHSIGFEGETANFDWAIEESKIEHREKYSMGAGYYLLDGLTWSSGWRVSKSDLKYFTGACADGEFPPEAEKPAIVDGVTITENEIQDGIEIRFPAKPDEDTRTALKAHKFRWSRHNGCWYHKRTDQAIQFANTLAA